MLTHTVLIVILCVSLAVSAGALWFLFNAAAQLNKGRRIYAKKKFSGLAVAAVFVCAAAGLCIAQAPRVIAGSALENIAPGMIMAVSLSLGCMVALVCLWFIFDTVCPQKNQTSYGSLVVLGALGGFGNFLIVSMINAGLNGLGQNRFAPVPYFMFGIAVYLSCQKLLRTRFVYLANGIVYAKRKNITEKILGTSFQTFEGIESGKIYAGLNNDTETVSESANLLILAITAALTILFCFIYLAIVNIWGLLASLAVISAAAVLYYHVGKKARTIWNQTRDIQNAFFKFISDMVLGFKELAVHEGKKAEFAEDMLGKCEEYRDKKIEASLKFTNVFILGELMFTLTIGAVTFLFPLLFGDMPVSTVRSFAVIFLYMSSPVYTLLNTIPNLIQVKISWERILELERGLSEGAPKYGGSPGGKGEETEGCQTEHIAAHPRDPEDALLELKDVSYVYKHTQGGTFCLGPLSCRFAPAEISFITGGNGSGKSTLAKLMLGLYPVDGGDILVGGRSVPQDQLGEYFSVIFSDNYIFDRLYGVDCRGKEAFICEQLRLLGLEGKLIVKDGVFSNTDLSTGQRKRLALLVSYLEDRPICLFDEWAADQDPAFRKFFYHELIFALKKAGKCVIAITHDDHYFHLADKTIKMNMGKIAV
ncbi:MAG: cyclic peptide export ABC transporter [Clostridiales bacterium]|jgi:cyclic peptide transporter|nr:cyclic peptide export ABC transporter [Clostridiales bacterium]